MSQAERIDDVSLNLNEILVDLPGALGSELKLLGSPIAVYFCSGESKIGRFYGFFGESNQLLLRSNETDEAIDLNAIRYVNFLQQIAGPAIEELPPAHHVELLFVDGRKLYVDAAYAFESDVGLTLFMFKSKHLYRIFIPHPSLSRFNVDSDSPSSVTERLQINLADFLNPEIHQAEPPVLVDTSFQLPKIAYDSRDVLDALQRKAFIPKLSFGGLLRALSVINEDQLNEALAQQQSRPDVHLGTLLKEQEGIDEAALAQVLAYKLGLPFVSLAHFDIDPVALSDITHDLAMQLHVMPLCLDGRRLVVAMDDPSAADSVQMIEFIAQKNIEISVASTEDIISTIEKHYGKKDDIDVYHHLQPLGLEQRDAGHDDYRDAEKLSKERPIVRLVNNLLTEAVRNKASDIHIRPAENHVDLMFRIDSNLVHIRRYSKSIHAAVVSRIKVIGEMDISERRVPQDGRAKIHVYEKHIDLRLSVMPTINGESVVIRLLDTTVGLKSLDEIGFEASELRQFKTMLDKSHGIVLVTGPTGSGKSTTLYAAIQYIRDSNVNIITAEDPVEYKIEGIEQMQVNHKIGYSFARILRNILRHDPDVIMIGEIRDQETSKIAVESSLTGHLVLSTLHTNSAAVTVTRLMEMGVEPYLINDTLLGVLAQRLVRLNCTYCMEEEEVEPHIYDTLKVSSKEVFYRGKGCEHCHNTGYKGRMAVYELLPLSPALKKLIKPGAGADAIEKLAVKEGMTPLTQNALNAARNKKISLSEVYRIRLG